MLKQERKSNRAWLALAVALVAILAVPNLLAQDVTGEVVLLGPEEPPFFGYDGPIGPEFWGELSANWTTCSTGQAQTPIDLALRNVTLALNGNSPIPDLEFDYHESSVNSLNNGHTIQFNYDAGSGITVGGTEFSLLQFHFHTPSEHTLEGGARFPLELHLVHRSGTGTLAVVGVLIRVGEELPGEVFEPERLRQVLPTADGVQYHLDAEVDAETLLPENRRPYHYIGSLTTPPCTEGVLWFVLKQPITMSKEQVDAIVGGLNGLRFASRGGSNARPIQPQNGRPVYLPFP